ncbi:hypothetical protein KJ359_013046 [Pestalotiopsis sp. 9143b]|nr:hypothetical protein KJ359_013046 [Pestalotiopsis sp. 9143b]
MFASTALAVAAALFAVPIAAKTDLAGCVSSATVAYGGASLIWYVPDTGEICEFLDCGGGRAPPKTTVPGCAAYSGTASYTPSYLAGYGSDSTPTSTAAAAGSTQESVMTTEMAATATATTTSAEASDATTVSELPTITDDTTALSGTVGTITSAATLATTTSGASSSMKTASSSSNSNGTVSSISPSNISQAAGSVATAGPMAMFLGVLAAAIL